MALFYIKDPYGWERPVETQSELSAAFEKWGENSDERLRMMYTKLVSEVEELIFASDTAVKLRGAVAARELACRKVSQ